MAPPRVRSANARSNSRTDRYRCPRHRRSSALSGSISSPRVNVAIASRNCRAPDWATPRSMMRTMFLGAASKAARAFLTASVSGSERYSTPSGERYCTDCPPLWPASSAGLRVIAAAMMDSSAARWSSVNRIRRILPACARTGRGFLAIRGEGSRSLDTLIELTNGAHRLALSTIVLYEWLRGPRARTELVAQEELFPSGRAVAFGPAEAAAAARLYKQVSRSRGGKST